VRELLALFLNRRKQQPYEDGYYRYDHEQFDKRKSFFVFRRRYIVFISLHINSPSLYAALAARQIELSLLKAPAAFSLCKPVSSRRDDRI
jgi:hypothetical protein